MRKTLKTILLAGTLLSLGIAQAQQATELAKHPGDTLKFEIKFDGPDAGKIKQVFLYLGSVPGRAPDQPGFDAGFRGNDAQLIGANTFKADITIPDNAATGDYILYVTANANPGGFQYKGGDQFPMHFIHIENPNTFRPPHIEVKPLP
jgi:hypothetical protein